MLVYIIITFDVGSVSAVVLEVFRGVGIFQARSWFPVLFYCHTFLPQPLSKMGKV